MIKPFSLLLSHNMLCLVLFYNNSSFRNYFFRTELWLNPHLSQPLETEEASNFSLPIVGFQESIILSHRLFQAFSV